MTLMAVRNWGKFLVLVEVNYCRLFDQHCPLHPIFTTSVPPFPIYQLAKLPLLQALAVAVCSFLLWETWKYHSKASKQLPDYGQICFMLTWKRLSLACQEGNDDQLVAINLMRVGQPTPSETFPNSNAARQEDQEADNPLTMLKSPGPPSFQ